MAKGVAVPDGHGYGVEYVNSYTASGPIFEKNGTSVLVGATALSLSLASPKPNSDDRNGDDGKKLTILSTGAVAHTVTTPLKFGTGAAGPGTITFTAVAGGFVELIAYNGVWYIGAKNGVTAA